MYMELLLHTLIIALGVNLLMFFPAFFFQTDTLTDLSYATTFVVVAAFALMQTAMTIPAMIVFTMIAVWATRLGGYLFIRIRSMKKDSRFNDMRKKWKSFLQFWLLQGFTVWMVMLAATLFFAGQHASLEALSLWGFIVWAAGLAIETIADNQKFTFKQTQKDTWIDTGLWHYSRHPNYLGEIMVWIGLFICVLPGLTQEQTLIAFLSPLFIAIMIYFVSGVPLLERKAEEKWGKDTKYLAYKQRTGELLPKPR